MLSVIRELIPFIFSIGARVQCTGRAAGRQTALDFGAQEFVDLDNDALEDVGAVDLVFDDPTPGPKRPFV
jgi:hypothetical protein